MAFVKRREFLEIHRESIVLSSMEKSGTNYLRLLLSNYIYNLLANDKEFKNIEYDAMQSELFPNTRSYVFEGSAKYQKPKLNLYFSDKTAYKDFMYDHGYPSEFFADRFHFSSDFLSPKKTIFLFRNPYDIIISRFFFFYKNRAGKEDQVEHPRELIDGFMPSFSKRYSRMKRLAAKDNNLMVAYEELKTDPQETVAKILDHLGIPVDAELVKRSIEAASIKKVKQTEKRMGRSIHTTKIKGSFVRSGEIGQWKDHFDQNDINQINQMLKERSIDVNEFIVE